MYLQKSNRTRFYRKFLLNNVSNIAVANFLLSYFGIKKPLTLFFIVSLASPLSKAIVGILLIVDSLIVDGALQPVEGDKKISFQPKIHQTT